MAVGEGLTLIAVHITPPTNPDGWRSSLGEVVADVRAQPTDLILGDFNATADHEPLRQLLDEGYRDAAEMTNHWQPTWPANGRRTGITGLLPPLARIDQVLVGPDLAVLTSETVRIAGTDHLAVVATIAYAEAAD